jgi:hypothetical protein
MPWTRWLLPLSGCSLLLAGAATAEPPPRLGVLAVGGYLVTGDWQLEVNVTTGTDSSNDTVNHKERARVLAYSEAESKRRGEQHDCLLVERVRGLRDGRVAPLGPGFAVAQQVQRQLTPPLLSL